MGAFKVVKLVDPIYVAANGVAVGHTGGTATSGTVNLYEGNNITFTTGAGAITIHGGAGAGGGVALAAGTQTATSGTINFANSNGITFGMSGSSRVTASYTVPTLTEYSFANSNGVSFGTNGSTVTATVKTDYLTSQSNQAVSAANGSFTFQTLTVANSNGVSFSTGTQGLYATVKTDYLTTARASNDAVGLNTAKTNVTWTVNSNGISLDAGAYLTTAAQSDHSHGNPTLALTNISGTTASASNGLTLSLSAAAPGAGGFQSAGLSTQGNTAGDTGFASQSLQLVGGNNITLSGSTNAGGLTLTISGANAGGAQTGISGIGVSDTTYTSGTVIHSAQANITIGSSVNGASQYLRYSVGPYITTARASTDAVGLNTAKTNVTWTVNSSGISFDASGYAGTATGATNASVTANSNGISVSVGPYITTARASTDAVGLNTALTAGPLAWTVNSSGISLNAGSAAGTSTGFGGNLISGSMTHNTAGLNLSLNHPAWLTTAMQSNAATISNINISGGTTSSNLSAFKLIDSNGVSWSVDTGSKIYATVKTDYLTTAAQSNHSHGNPTLALTNISGTTASASNGLTLSLSAADPGAGGAVTVSASNGSFTAGNLNFSNANNVTFGTSAGSIVTASVAAPGAAAENNNINLLGANTAGNTTASGSTIGYSGINLTLSGTNDSVVNISAPATSQLSATGGLSISTNGSTISIGNIAMERFVNEPAITQVATAVSASLVSIFPIFIPAPLSVSNMRWGISYSAQTTANNSTGMNVVSASYVIYSRNGSSLSSVNSGSNTFTASWSSNATASVNGVRGLTADLATASVFNPGEYWVALHMSSATSAFNTSGTSGQTAAMSMLVGATAGTAAMGLDPYGQATQATRGASLGLGVISTGATRGSIAFSQITQSGTRAMAAKLWIDLRNYSIW